MRKITLCILLGFLMGAITILTPDLVHLYAENVMRSYVKKYCHDKGLYRNDCYFSTFYDPYEKENPKLVEWDYYFEHTPSIFYMVITKRCTNEIFYNPSATEKSGKITKREYFKSQCLGEFTLQFSDFLWGKK